MARRLVRVDPETVERLRVARGFRYQSDLADAAGVDQGTISKMERRSGPYELATVEKVARALGVAVDALRANEAEAGPSRGAILLRAFTAALGPEMSRAEKRKLARDLWDAARLLFEEAGDGGVNADTTNRATVRLSGRRNARRAVGATAG